VRREIIGAGVALFLYGAYQYSLQRPTWAKPENQAQAGPLGVPLGNLLRITDPAFYAAIAAGAAVGHFTA
jgi:hypothetical protein